MLNKEFIENVNAVKEKLDIIIEANKIFDDGVIPILEEIAELDLKDAITDLRKGNYLGNRKIDMNLSLNMQGITQNLIDKAPDIAEAIWIDETKRVTYDYADVTFVDGITIRINFVFDSYAVTISTHSDFLIQLTNHTDFTDKLEDTLIAGFASDVVGEIIRLYDVVGTNSNIERIQLHAVSGSYIDQNPIYYWAKTTSAFQTLSMRAGDIIKLGNEIDNLILVANRINELLNLQTNLVKLIGADGEETLYNRLSELVALHTELSKFLVIYEDIKQTGTNYIQSVASDLENDNNIGTVASDLNLGADSNIKKVGANIDSINDVNNNETNINDVNNNKININAVKSKLLEIEEIVNNMDAIIDSKANAEAAVSSAVLATEKSDEIKAINGEQITNILASGGTGSVSYNSITGKFTFNIPKGNKGEKGESFTVNAVGSLANRALYNAQIENFAYLATDVMIDGATKPHIYFRVSEVEGTWSAGSPFGQGDKGDIGISIASITFKSTTDVSGLEAKSGATDTYEILFTDGTKTTYPIKNGLDSAVLSVAGKTGNVTLQIADIIGLSSQISNITTMITSDDTTLDEIQEIVNYIKQNKDDLQNLDMTNIAGLVTALGNKADVNHNHDLAYEAKDSTILKEEDIGDKVLSPTGSAAALTNLPSSGTVLLFEKSLFGGL